MQANHIASTLAIFRSEWYVGHVLFAPSGLSVRPRWPLVGHIKWNLMTKLEGS
jgi:hypothetical protein